MTTHKQDLAVNCTNEQAEKLINALAMRSNEKWQYAGRHRLETGEFEYRFYKTDLRNQNNGFIKFDGYVAFLFNAGTLYAWDCYINGQGISTEQNNLLIDALEGEFKNCCTDLGLSGTKGKATVR